MHDTIGDIFGKDSNLWSTLDQMFAFMRGDPTDAPTPAEIDATFDGVDPELAVLCKKLATEKDEQISRELGAAMRKRWEALGPAKQGQAQQQLRARVGDARALKILMWLRSKGVA
jgi:hypothetical protein